MNNALVYLDMNIYNCPFDNQEQWRIRLETVACQRILQLAQEQTIDLAWSFVLDYENSLNPFPERREKIEILSQLARQTIEFSENLLQLAERFEQTGIKNKDAAHLACAEMLACGFFVTCDDKLVKKARQLNLNIKVCNPIDFIYPKGVHQ